MKEFWRKVSFTTTKKWKILKFLQKISFLSSNISIAKKTDFKVNFIQNFMHWKKKIMIHSDSVENHIPLDLGKN